MMRTVASLGLTFGAMAWALFASTFVFFYGSSFWIGALGRFGAFWGALTAFIVGLLIARAMLRLADKLIEPYSGPFDSRAYEGAPPDTFYRDWQGYAAEVVRNRRYAFYMRTRQWDKAAQVEQEIQLARRRQPEKMPDPPHPRRTTMANRVSWEENRRASRRTSAHAPKIEKWRVEDD